MVEMVQNPSFYISFFGKPGAAGSIPSGDIYFHFESFACWTSFLSSTEPMQMTIHL